MRKTQLIFRTVLMLLIIAASSLAHAQSLFDNFEFGARGVGFKFIYKTDYTRTWKATEDINGYSQSENRGRPIRVSVWYPAKNSANAARMFYKDYMPASAKDIFFAELNGLLAKRDINNLRANLSAEDFDKLMQTRTRAVQNAAPMVGKFPLVVYSAGLNNSAQDNFVLCEYLASHGFVVVTVPQTGATSLDANLKFPSAADLETQTLDLQFAVGATHDLPDLDKQLVGAIGYSVGGMAAMNFAMRNTDIDALVTLDPTFLVANYIKFVNGSPFYAPANLCIPWLLMHRVEPQITTLTLSDELKYSRRYRVEMTGMFHQDFSSFPMFAPQSITASTRTPETAKRGYQTICRYILNFLNAFLKKDKSGFEFINDSSRKDESIAKFEVLPAIEPPTTEEKFTKILYSESVAKAIKLYRDYKTKNAQEQIFGESFLNQLGYRLISENRLNDAIEIFKLNVEAYPASGNVYDSLAEAYLKSGNKELAIKFYEKAVELAPGNKAAIELLKKLKANQ